MPITLAEIARVKVPCPICGLNYAVIGQPCANCQSLNHKWEYVKEECNYCGHKLAKDNTEKLTYIICVNPECQRFHSVVRTVKRYNTIGQMN